MTSSSLLTMPTRRLLLVVNSEDVVWTRRLNFSAFNTVVIRNRRYYTWAEAMLDARSMRCDCIATTQFPFHQQELEGTQEDNAGSLLRRDGIDILLLTSLTRMSHEPHAHWLLQHWLSKLTAPQRFLQPDPFSYRVATVADRASILRVFDAAADAGLFVAVDIETCKEGLLITSVAYTAVVYSATTKRLTTRSWAIDVLADPEPAFALISALNQHRVHKCFHRGIYDNAYFIRFGVPPVAWTFDTYNFNHCLYPELGNTLAFNAQLYLHRVRYWKEMAQQNKLEYNARDTHNTAWVLLGQLHHIAVERAEYAITNYAIEHPLNFPFLHWGLDGLAVDTNKREELKAKEAARAEAAQHRLAHILGVRNFNPGSPKQVSLAMHGLGFSGQGTDKKAMQTFKEAGPLEEFLAGEIETYRKASKAVSTYYEFELLGNRMLYEIDCAGTDTGRAASSASQFWCGTQIQNIPAYAKAQFVPDTGWEFGSVDGAQAESRCTAYISQDANLMHTVEHSPDFHCTNASLFFGIPFDQLFDVGTMTVLNKALRTVAKRVNHGANYNMGPRVLWETMGTKAVYNAARLLGLSPRWQPLRICKYLLECFMQAYPGIKGRWYGEVVQEAWDTGRLVGPTGWTRRTFLLPEARRKPELNSCVAHPPQSLSVMIINKVAYKAWRLQMTTLRGRLRGKAQIHDEIFFMHRPGDSEVPQLLADIYSNTTVQVHGRTLRIPSEPKFGAKNWGELKE